MAKTIKHAFLYCDKTWVFDQSERTYGRIYITTKNINAFIEKNEKQLYLHESVSLEVLLKHRALRTIDIYISGSFLLDQHETNALD